MKWLRVLRLIRSRGRAVRLISLFQELFEANFSFDLELVAKKGLKPAQKQFPLQGGQ